MSVWWFYQGGTNLQLCQSHLIPIFRLEERGEDGASEARVTSKKKLMEASLATEPATSPSSNTSPEEGTLIEHPISVFVPGG
jgi:hypothetical protein